MIFLESDFSIRILSIQRLNWQFNNAQVSPRPFNALSFRVKGNSVISNEAIDVHLTDGDILFMPRNVAYHTMTAEEELIVVHFDIDGPNQDYFEMVRPKHPQAYEAIFSSMCRIWNDRGQGYYFQTMSLLYSLFAKLTNHLPQVENAAYAKIRKSVEYIEQHFKEPSININTLCHLSFVSNTYFRKLFFDLYQTTPLRYINLLRINYAAELLETGYYSVETVAAKSGFDDPKYFSSVFKKYMNCSPAAYKKQMNSLSSFNNQK